MVPDPINFPYLNANNYVVTSPETAAYNCIAWAADDTTRWWWPDPYFQAYWPEAIRREATLDAFIKLFESLGYSLCERDNLENGHRKIAVYALDGEPTHAARQLENGQWTSKLGRNIDLEHALNALNGPLYGRVATVFKR